MVFYTRFMDLANIIKTTYQQNKEGYITARTNHSGNGLGYLNEKIFNVNENNIAGPDVPHLNLELKSSNADSECLVTLATNSPKINLKNEGKRTSATRYMVENFAKMDETNPLRRNLYHTIRIGKTTTINNHDFTITRTSDNIWITSLTNDEHMVGWHTDKLLTAIEKKIGNGKNKGALLITKASSTKVEDDYHFKFTKATLYEGFSKDKFIELFDKGRIVVDLRAHSVDVGKPSLKIRDHGTAFRLTQSDIQYMYSNVTECLE